MSRKKLPNGKLVWTLSYDGIDIYFNRYDPAPLDAPFYNSPWQDVSQVRFDDIFVVPGTKIDLSPNKRICS
jgi:hypothetical protein